MLKEFLRLMFTGPNGLQTTGVPIVDQHGNAVAVLFAELSILFSDGEGIRSCLNWKGASGLKPCYRHWNVVAKGTGLITGGDDDEYVDICCSDPNKFKVWSSAELYSTIDMVNAAHARYVAGTMMKYQFENIQMTAGYNANQYGLLADPAFREYFKKSNALNMIGCTSRSKVGQ